MASREIILVRHAHAETATTTGQDDIARILSLRGEAEADAAGAWLKKHGAAPTRVLCSPAARARETCERVLAVLGYTDLRSEARIYEATPATLLRVLDDHADAGPIMLVGHNPGLETLVALMTEGASDSGRGIPPAGVVWLALPEAQHRARHGRGASFLVAVSSAVARAPAHRAWWLLAALSLVAGMAHAAGRHDDVALLDSARSQRAVPGQGRCGWSASTATSARWAAGSTSIASSELAVVDARIDCGRGADESARLRGLGEVGRVLRCRARIRKSISCPNPFPLQRLHDGGSLPGTLTIARRQRAGLVRSRCGGLRAARLRAARSSPTATIRRSAFGMRSRLGTLSDKVELQLLRVPASRRRRGCRIDRERLRG